jgi:competence protein ComEC
VTIAIMPIISYNFGTINILGILYNILCIPLFSLILFINIIFILLSPVTIVAQSLGTVISLLVAVFLWIVNKLAAFKFSFFPVEFNITAISLYYLILIGILGILVRRRQRETLDLQGFRE